METSKGVRELHVRECRHANPSRRAHGYRTSSQTRPTELWEDNASCILMSENPTDRDRCRHVDVRVHNFLDMARDGAVKLSMCSAGRQNAECR